MRVLIVKRAALGDVVRATSLLGPLRARWPRAELAWVTGEKALPLLEGLGVDAMTLEEAERRLPPRAFDRVLSLEEDGRCASLAARCAAGELVGVVERDGRLGYTPSSKPYYGMSLLRPASAGGKAAADALKAANRESWARLWCRVLGLEPGPAPRPALALGEAERAAAATRAAALSGGRPLLGFSPWAAPDWPAKSLSVEAAASAARAMAATGFAVTLLAGPERAAERARAAALAGAGVSDSESPASLRDYAALVAACDAVLCADTLAAHLAAAAQRPVAVFVGPTAAAELDLGPRGFTFGRETPCECFYRAACARPPSCLESLPPEAFAAAASRLLAAAPA